MLDLSTVGYYVVLIVFAPFYFIFRYMFFFPASWYFYEGKIELFNRNFMSEPKYINPFLLTIIVIFFLVLSISAFVLGGMLFLVIGVVLGWMRLFKKIRCFNKSIPLENCE